jgi:DnaJ-class molecular chaperone
MVVDLTKCTTCEGRGSIGWTSGPRKCPDCIGELERLRAIGLTFGFMPKGVLEESPIMRLVIQAP